jgi:hypothetical protein
MNLLEPTNHRISNSLFDAINRVRNGILESTVATEGAVDKAHFCATHVEHLLLGKGTCISEQHAEPDENGDIAWYSVEFPSGIQRVNTSNLKIVEGKSHSHGKKMAEEEEVAAEENVDEALTGNQHKIDANKNNKIDAHDFKLLRAKKKPMEEGNDGNLANNAKPYDKVTHGDVITGRLGKDEMGGKKKVKEAKEPKRSTGTAFDPEMRKGSSPLTADQRSAFNKKKISTGTVYSRKTPGKVKENVTQTIINHNDFVLEVTDNPTYGDYLRALQSMVGQTSEDVQQEIVTIATEAFNENYTDVIIESQTKKIFESKFEDIRMSGGKVLGENYMVDSGEPYVEYTVEKDGKAIQYVHLGTIKTV